MTRRVGIIYVCENLHTSDGLTISVTEPRRVGLPTRRAGQHWGWKLVAAGPNPPVALLEAN